MREGAESGYGTYTEDPNMNLITQYGLRLLVLVFELGLGLVLYYRIGSSLCVPSPRVRGAYCLRTTCVLSW